MSMIKNDQVNRVNRPEMLLHRGLLTALVVQKQATGMLYEEAQRLKRTM